MKDPKALYTVAEADALIEEIGRHVLGLEGRVESRTWTAEERATDPKFDAMCGALERRAELEAEIKGGIRSPDGTLLNIRV